jgi:tripartite-type tricarboxylate transporter receptor subunit TctC
MALFRLQVAIAAFCAAVLLTGTISDAHAADPFYKGKRITLLINFAAGGPTDIEGRLFAKYLVKHIEGEPGIIVQNMDGAGGLVGASYLGEVAPKDGTYIGYLSGTSWLYVSEPNAGASISGATSSSPISPARR